MDKWIKAGVVATFGCFGVQLWVQLKAPVGSTLANYIPSILTAVSALLVSSAALFSFGKWPFDRWMKPKPHVSEKASPVVLTIMLDRCRALLKAYRSLGSADPANTKKPLTSNDSWPLPEGNNPWTYTQLQLYRLSADYRWLMNTAKWCFKEMGWDINIPFFNKVPYYMAEVLAALEKFDRVLESKISALGPAQ